MSLPEGWQEQLEDAQRLRGWIVNSFAQVEFLLGDLILRCREFPAYEEHTRTLPHGASDRIARVRTILNRSGPLDPDANDILAILDHLAAQQDTRNLLVHGFATALHTSSEEMGFHFQKFHRQPGRHDARLIRTFTLDGLRREREDQTAFAEAAVGRFQAMHRRMGWEGPMSDEFLGDAPFEAGRCSDTPSRS